MLCGTTCVWTMIIHIWAKVSSPIHFQVIAVFCTKNFGVPFQCYGPVVPMVPIAPVGWWWWAISEAQISLSVVNKPLVYSDLFMEYLICFWAFVCIWSVWLGHLITSTPALTSETPWVDYSRSRVLFPCSLEPSFLLCKIVWVLDHKDT